MPAARGRWPRLGRGVAGGWAVALLSGCLAVGPAYRAPVLAQPAAYPDAGASMTVALVPPPPPVPARPLAHWWSAFGDKRLDELLEQGLAANHDIRLAVARLRQTRAELGIADARFGPRVHADAGVTRVAPTQEGPLPLPLSPFTLWDAGFDASWELDVWGAVRRGHEAAVGDLDAAVWDARGALVSVTAEIVRSYLALQAASQRVHIAELRMAVAQQQAAVAQRRLRAGLTAMAEVSQAMGAVDDAVAQLTPRQSEVYAERYRLALLLGKDPGALDAELADPAPLPELPPVLEAGIPADLLRRRPDLHAAERRLAAATARVGIATADFYPRLSLTGLFGVASTSTGSLVSKAAVMWSVGPSIRWNLLDWGATRHGVEAAQAQVDAALISYDAALRQAEDEVATQLVACSQDRLAAQALARALAHTAIDVRIADELHERGLVSQQTLLAAQAASLTAGDQLVVGRLAMATAIVALAKALGGGWEEVAAPIAAQQPDAAPPAPPAPEERP